MCIFSLLSIVCRTVLLSIGFTTFCELLYCLRSTSLVCVFSKGYGFRCITLYLTCPNVVDLAIDNYKARRCSHHAYRLESGQVLGRNGCRLLGCCYMATTGGQSWGMRELYFIFSDKLLTLAWVGIRYGYDVLKKIPLLKLLKYYNFLLGQKWNCMSTCLLYFSCPKPMAMKYKLIVSLQGNSQTKLLFFLPCDPFCFGMALGEYFRFEFQLYSQTSL